MKTHSPSLPVAHVTFLGLVRMATGKISDALAEARARRRSKAANEFPGQVDVQFLDDIGMAQPRMPAALETLAQMNPAFLAATAFSLPRSGRR
jgi:hypothetical protein